MTMASAARRVDLVRYDGDVGAWAVATGTPSPVLAEVVSGPYQGYIESRASFERRREVPTGGVVLIINLGPAFRISGPREPTGGRALGSFVVGVYDTFAFSEATGAAECMQVNLTPMGAFRVFGMPMHELANRTVALEDLLSDEAPRLASRLHDLASWAERFALLDDVLVARLLRAPTSPAWVAWTWRRLMATGGRVRIDRLAAEVGCSHRHLISVFRAHVGLPPRLMGRLLRFRRAHALVDAVHDTPLASIAVDCGYSDQAHMNRDFRQFVGCAPGVLRRQRTADHGEISGGECIVERP